MYVCAFHFIIIWKLTLSRANDSITNTYVRLVERCVEGEIGKMPESEGVRGLIY
jgi:hypothetical protein